VQLCPPGLGTEFPIPRVSAFAMGARVKTRALDSPEFSHRTTITITVTADVIIGSFARNGIQFDW